MCDIEFARKKIDAMILDAIEPFWFCGQWSEAALTDRAVASLSDRFSDICSEACIRARCEMVVVQAIKSRRP